MKRAVAFLLLTALMLCFCACEAKEKNGIAFICGESGVEERFEGQAIKTAVYNYCTEQNIPYFEYISDGTEGFYAKAAASAAKNCNIVVCDSKASAVLSSDSGSYDTSFLFVNHSGNAASNARCVSICEEDAAFLAGYAAVMDGNDSLAFLGGEKSEISLRYMNGFIQGVNAAAGDKNITVTYYFSGSDEASDETKDIAQDIFIDGCDIIFVSGGMIYKSAVQAANVTKKFLIGGEMDQAGESERFVTTAMKNYSDMIPAELNEFFKAKAWSADFSGKSVLYRYSHGAVGLPEYAGAFRFKQCTAESYAELKALLDSGTLKVTRGTSVPTVSQNVTVTEYTPEVETEASDTSSVSG